MERVSHPPIDPFIALSTGGRFYPLGPDPERILIEDIAHSLSHQCRFAGHTSEFWSVAAHSIEVARRVEASFYRGMHPSEVAIVTLTALLHDASEAYLQDIVRPVKPLVHGYYQWEENVERAIAQRFGLRHPWPSLIEAVDKGIVLDEVASFFPEGSAAWQRYGIRRRSDHAALVPLEPATAREWFLNRFNELQGRVS